MTQEPAAIFSCRFVPRVATMIALRISILFAFCVFVAIVCAQVSLDSDSHASPKKIHRFTTGLKTLWKRRRGGGSDSDSNSNSGSGSSSYYDADDYTDNSSSGGGDDGGWYTCYPEKNITREAHNNDGYGGYYAVGNGQCVSPEYSYVHPKTVRR